MFLVRVALLIHNCNRHQSPEYDGNTARNDEIAKSRHYGCLSRCRTLYDAWDKRRQCRSLCTLGNLLHRGLRHNGLADATAAVFVSALILLSLLIMLDR